jgi:hypothetical protein
MLKPKFFISLALISTSPKSSFWLAVSYNKRIKEVSCLLLLLMNSKMSKKEIKLLSLIIEV